MIINFLGNKRGSDGTEGISLWHVGMMVVLLLGVMLVLNEFNKGDMDIRSMEEMYLAQHIAKCLSNPTNNFTFNKGLVDSFNQELEGNFLETCRLNFDVGDSEEIEYFARINYYDYSLFDLDLINSPIKSIYLGNINLEIGKQLEKEVVPYYFYVSNKTEEFVLEIIPIVRKGDKNE